MEMKWYVLYTEPGCEKKVSQILKRKEILHFCPSTKVVRPGKENKVREDLLFNRYVFVKTLEHSFSKIKGIKGVINFTYRLQLPAVIDDSDINLMKDFLNNHINVKIERAGISFANNHNSDMFDYKPRVIYVKNRVKVVLPSLGYEIFSEFEESVIPLKAAKKILPQSEINYRHAL
jgi:transcription antitermination factor NusG